MTERLYRYLFLIACLWNIAGGVLFRIFMRPVFSRAGMPPPDPPVFYDIWIAMVLVFGLAYFLVSRNPLKNTDLVMIGAAAKGLFVAIFLYAVLSRPPLAPRIFLLAVAGDLLFIVLFFSFLGFARGLARRQSGI